MRLSRRTMLRGAAAAGLAAGAATALPDTAGAEDRHRGGLRVPRDRISVQLYSLRTLLEQDVPGTLSALADIGYRKVELAGTYGYSPAEFRAVLDRNHLRATSGHVGIDGDLDQLVADARTLGNSRVVVPWVKYATLAEWQAFVGRLDAAAKVIRRAGLRLGYHNHDHELLPVEGRRPFDLIAEGTSPRHLHFEIDLYWAVTAGADPVRLVYANHGRVDQFHVKDRAADGSFADLGTGTIDFPAIFRRTWAQGVKEYIVEHDQPTDPLRTAEVGYRYLAHLRF